MQYHLVQNFVTIAKTGNITRTAEVLFVAQSTVSHRLTQLEEELGSTLVRRGKGRRFAELTESGESFLPLAEKWLELWQETARFRTEKVASRLTVGCVNSLVTCLLRDFFPRFLEQHPGMRLKVLVLETDEIYQKLNAGEVNLGIVLTNLPYQNVRIRPLLAEKMYCVCHKDMYPGIERIRTDMLLAENEVLLNWGMEFMLWHDFHFHRTVESRLEVNQILLVQDGLSRQGAWAVVPETVADYFLRTQKCRCLTLENPPPDRISYVVTPLAASPEVGDLTTLFQKELDEFLGDRVGLA